MRRAAAVVTTFVLCAGSLPARAQSSREANTALSQHTIDPAALAGVPAPFLEYGLPEHLGWSAATGLPFAGGLLRATYTSSWQLRVAGLGYARTLAARELGWFGTLATGVDFAAGYNLAHSTAFAERAVRVSVPVSLRWGSPTRFSFVPYVAPFMERGSQSWIVSDCADCFTYHRGGLLPTRSNGLTAGFGLNVWRLGFDFAERDVIGQHRFDGQYSAAIRWRF